MLFLKKNLWTTTTLLFSSSSLSSSPSRNSGSSHDSHHRGDESNCNRLVSLQQQHPERSPQQIFQHLADDARSNGVDRPDVYGDFDDAAATAFTSTSFLRHFERTVADDLGLEDAVFMPSGVMAQSIALLIHRDNHRRRSVAEADGTAASPPTDAVFACHHSSHLLLHEQDAFRELLGMECEVLPLASNSDDDNCAGSDMSLPSPLTYAEVVHALDRPWKKQKDGDETSTSDGETTELGLRRRDVVSTLLLELPHRELGGKLTPWDDVLQMREYCTAHGLAFHCDGARLWEAAVAGYNNDGNSISDLTAPFDSVYVSFYKGLGGLSGAMLLGDKHFCAAARIWLRRFGGNLYTLMPYALSGWAGYQRYWKLHQTVGDPNDDDDDNRPFSPPILSFAEKTNKLQRIVHRLNQDDVVERTVRFDPKVPETCMVHGYLKASLQDCTEALARLRQPQAGLPTDIIPPLHRLRAVTKADRAAHRLGYQCRFEWNMGQANGVVPDEVFVKSWKAFCDQLVSVLDSNKVDDRKT